MLDAIEPSIRRPPQAYSLSDDETREVLALTLMFLISQPVKHHLAEMRKRLEKTIKDVKNADAMTSIIRPKVPKTDKVLSRIFSVVGPGETGEAHRRGRPRKEFRNALAARLIGFLEFASGEPVQPTSDKRASNFLEATLVKIGEDYHLIRRVQL